jgi:cytochrome c-type biogenesis protein CcmH
MHHLVKKTVQFMLVLCLGIMSLLMVAPVAAQGGEDYPEGVDPTEVYRISRSMYCDVCEGVPLSDCPSDQCIAWREEIGQLLAEGQNESEIRQHFASRYGEKVSGVPLDEENRLFVFVIPAALSVLVIGVLGWQIWRWQQQTPTALQAARGAGSLEGYDRPVPDNVDPAVLARVLQDLEVLKQ